MASGPTHGNISIVLAATGVDVILTAKLAALLLAFGAATLVLSRQVLAHDW